MTAEEIKYFDTSEWEGFAIRETKFVSPSQEVINPPKDVVKVDPLIAAGDEGMIDKREYVDMAELTADIATIIQQTERLF